MLYLTVTLATGVLAWLLLSAFASPRLLSEAGDAVNARLFIQNGRVKFGRYPLRYIPRIQQIPGVDDITWLNIIGYNCDNATGKHLTVTGRGGRVERIFHKYGVNEADIAMWHNTENGVLASAEAARRCGFSPGNTVSPRVNGNEMPLYVVSVFPGGDFDETVDAHYDYVNRFQHEKDRDTILSTTVYVRNPGMVNQIANAIEREFESSDPPLEAVVYAETSILGRFGQVQWLLLLVIGAMALCVFLVFCAVLMHLTAQRRANMAVLQTLGFTARIQFFALLLEIASIITIGSMLGIIAGYGILSILHPWAANTLLGSNLSLVEGTVVILIPAGLLLLVIALAWPAMQILQLKPIYHLRI